MRTPILNDGSVASITNAVVGNTSLTTPAIPVCESTVMFFLIPAFEPISIVTV